MPASPSFRDYVLEQLNRTGLRVTSRAMFGGVGIYAGPLFFALVASDRLYFKVDDSNRPDFLERQMGPFRPFGEDGETMNYYEVPGDVLDDAELLAGWTEKAVQVARAKKALKRDQPPGKGGRKLRGR